jgi:hypothetical protein
MAATAFSPGASACTESYVMSRTLGEGPKLFACDALACEAFGNFDLSVPAAPLAAGPLALPAVRAGPAGEAAGGDPLVLVNAHLFLGAPADTVVTYRVQ